jgi:hypothetical protein
MADRGFSSPGKPGSAEEASWKRRYLVKLRAVPVVKTLWVHRSSALAFNALVLIWQRNGEQMGKVVDDWGWANRDIRGVAEDSYHRYGKALDGEATENPQHGLRTGFPRTITHEACELLELVWGFDWSAKFRDPMHVQDELTRRRRRWVNFRLLHPSKRRHRLAQLAHMKPREFSRRIKQYEPYPS